MDNNEIICICNQITRGTIVNAIANGATTVEDVRKQTTASAGACRGGRCLKKIQAIIDDMQSK